MIVRCGPPCKTPHQTKKRIIGIKYRKNLLLPPPFTLTVREVIIPPTREKILLHLCIFFSQYQNHSCRNVRDTASNLFLFFSFLDVCVLHFPFFRIYSGSIGIEKFRKNWKIKRNIFPARGQNNKTAVRKGLV